MTEFEKHQLDGMLMGWPRCGVDGFDDGHGQRCGRYYDPSTMPKGAYLCPIDDCERMSDSAWLTGLSAAAKLS